MQLAEWQQRLPGRREDWPADTLSPFGVGVTGCLQFFDDLCRQSRGCKHASLRAKAKDPTSQSHVDRHLQFEQETSAFQTMESLTGMRFQSRHGLPSS